jgi:hypothetical protein
MLLDSSEYRAPTPRRPGKGRPLPDSPSEGEMEVSSRKDAQKACRRLIVPKPASGETPDAFIRRLDAHRAVPDALIAPMVADEDEMQFAKRCAATKEQVNIFPILILPKSKFETAAEFEERLGVAKACAALVFPRGTHESPENFKTRMSRQKKCKRSIMPRSKGEPTKGFDFRCEVQILCGYVIHPYDGARESEALFGRRLQAQKAKSGLGFEPGDERAVNNVMGPPPKEGGLAAGKEEKDGEEEEDGGDAAETDGGD